MKTVQIALARTCNQICWHARGKSCRCVCGGRNHGAMRRGAAGDNDTDNGQTPDGEDPEEREYQLAVTFDKP